MNKNEFRTFKIARVGSSAQMNQWQANQLGEIRILLWNGVTKEVIPTLSGGHPGRRYLCLSSNDYKYVHRIVADLFIPNPYNLKTVDHINGDKMDNRVSNLQWMTYKENKSKG